MTSQPFAPTPMNQTTTIPSLADVLSMPLRVADGLPQVSNWTPAMSKNQVIDRLVECYVSEEMPSRNLIREVGFFKIDEEHLPEIDRRMEILRIERALSKPSEATNDELAHAEKAAISAHPAKMPAGSYLDLDWRAVNAERASEDNALAMPIPRTIVDPAADPNRVFQDGKEITGDDIKALTTKRQKEVRQRGQEFRLMPPQIPYAPLAQLPQEQTEPVEIVLTEEMTYRPSNDRMDLLLRAAKLHQGGKIPGARMRSEFIHFRITPEAFNQALKELPSA